MAGPSAAGQSRKPGSELHKRRRLRGAGGEDGPSGRSVSVGKCRATGDDPGTGGNILFSLAFPSVARLLLRTIPKSPRSALCILGGGKLNCCCFAVHVVEG